MSSDPLQEALQRANATHPKVEKKGRKGYNGDEIVVGVPVQEVDLPVDDQGHLTDAALELVNERGIQKALAAAIIGVGNASVSEWVRAGRIALTLDGFIPLREVRRMTIEVALAKRGRKNRDEGGTGIHAESRLKTAQADMKELELEKLRGTLVSRESAARAFAEAAVVTRTRLMGVADSVAATVIGKKDHVEVVSVIRTHIAEALETLADIPKAFDGAS